MMSGAHENQKMFFGKPYIIYKIEIYLNIRVIWNFQIILLFTNANLMVLLESEYMSPFFYIIC